MRIPDHVLGLVLFIVSIIYATMALRLPSGSPGLYGPHVFPLLIASGAAASSIVLMLRAIRRKPVRAPEDVAQPANNWLNGAVVLAVIVYSILALEELGFILTIAPALIVMLALLGVRPVRALVIGAVATFCIEYAFRVVLHVPLPSGPGMWGFL
jgi:putative tricarboxylic transport membrane protein